MACGFQCRQRLLLFVHVVLATLVFDSTAHTYRYMVANNSDEAAAATCEDTYVKIVHVDRPWNVPGTSDYVHATTASNETRVSCVKRCKNSTAAAGESGTSLLRIDSWWMWKEIWNSTLSRKRSALYLSYTRNFSSGKPVNHFSGQHARPASHAFKRNCSAVFDWLPSLNFVEGAADKVLCTSVKNFQTTDKCPEWKYLVCTVQDKARVFCEREPIINRTDRSNVTTTETTTSAHSGGTMSTATMPVPTSDGVQASDTATAETTTSAHSGGTTSTATMPVPTSDGVQATDTAATITTSNPATAPSTTTGEALLPMVTSAGGGGPVAVITSSAGGGGPVAVITSAGEGQPHTTSTPTGGTAGSSEPNSTEDIPPTSGAVISTSSASSRAPAASDPARITNAPGTSNVTPGSSGPGSPADTRPTNSTGTRASGTASVVLPTAAGGSTGHLYIYVGVGVGLAVLIVCSLVIVAVRLLCKRRRAKRSHRPSRGKSRKAGGNMEIKETLKVTYTQTKKKRNPSSSPAELWIDNNDVAKVRVEDHLDAQYKTSTF